MKSKEIIFNKYDIKGAYHWKDISKNPFRCNSSVKARYNYCIKLLENSLGSLKNKKILDIGCGDGVLSYMLWLKGAKVFGSDPSVAGISLANNMHKRLKTDAVFESNQNYSYFENDLFDAIICSDVIEHVQKPDTLLKQIKKQLNNNGIGILSTNLRFSKYPLDQMHVQEWFEEDFIKMIEKYFDDSEFYKSHPLFWMELLNYRYAMITINLLAIIIDLFTIKWKWRKFDMIYCVVTNKQIND
jgi:2-polyprenyl-3-methyl-5-hydroxy-6-metoxy-1,4-benzoquinol methylase